MSLIEGEVQHDIQGTFCSSIRSSGDTCRCSPRDLASAVTAKEAAGRAGMGPVAFPGPDEKNCFLVQILLSPIQLSQETCQPIIVSLVPTLLGGRELNAYTEGKSSSLGATFFLCQYQKEAPLAGKVGSAAWHGVRHDPCLPTLQSG